MYMYKIELDGFQLQRVTIALNMARQYFVDASNNELNDIMSDKYMFVASEYSDVFEDIVRQKAIQDSNDTTINANR